MKKGTDIIITAPEEVEGEGVRITLMTGIAITEELHIFQGGVVPLQGQAHAKRHI
jgi:hypothetical protein